MSLSVPLTCMIERRSEWAVIWCNSDSKSDLNCSKILSLLREKLEIKHVNTFATVSEADVQSTGIVSPDQSSSPCSRIFRLQPSVVPDASEEDSRKLFVNNYRITCAEEKFFPQSPLCCLVYALKSEGW